MGKVFEEHVRYHKALKKVYEMMECSFNPKATGVPKTGYCLLIFRDNESGNTDMVTNLTTDCVKMALEDILRTLDK